MGAGTAFCGSAAMYCCHSNVNIRLSSGAHNFQGCMLAKVCSCEFPLDPVAPLGVEQEWCCDCKDYVLCLYVLLHVDYDNMLSLASSRSML